MTQQLFDALGFEWDRRVVSVEPRRKDVREVLLRFKKLLAEFVWDAAALEGNPFTFVEVQTLLDGITVGGRRLTDQNQVLNLAESAKRLAELVARGQFRLDKPTFCELHALVANKEAFDPGLFRGEGEIMSTPDVALGNGEYMTPMETEKGGQNLTAIFERGVAALEENCPPYERALAFFLFAARQQFFFDGNKRTGRMMMNGVLMSHGLDAISVPASRQQEFNERMVAFYKTGDATEMMDFLVSCDRMITKTLSRKNTDDLDRALEGQEKTERPLTQHASKSR